MDVIVASEVCDLDTLASRLTAWLSRQTAALSTMVLHNAGPQHKLLKQLLPSLRRTAELITSKLVADAVGPGPLVSAGDPD